MAPKQCAAPGCAKFVRRGKSFCLHHQNSEPEEVITEHDLTNEMHSPAFDEAADEFDRRLEAGDYRFLFGEALNEVIQQAAEERGLADEIGILRVVLARILFEERDPAQLAESVSRVAGVAIQAARAQRAINGEQAGGLTDALTHILVELDATSDRS